MYLILDHTDKEREDGVGILSVNDKVKLIDIHTGANFIANTQMLHDSFYQVFGLGATDSGILLARITDEYLWRFANMVEYSGVLDILAKPNIDLDTRNFYLIRGFSTRVCNPSDLYHSYIKTEYRHTPYKIFFTDYLLALVVIYGIPSDGLICVPVISVFEKGGVQGVLGKCLVYRVKDVDVMKSFITKFKCFIPEEERARAQIDKYRRYQFLHGDSIRNYTILR